jgi:hypothetical protein
MIGGALAFDGQDDVVGIPRPVQDDFTLAFWMRADGNSYAGTVWLSGNRLVSGPGDGTEGAFGATYLGNRIAFGTGSPAHTMLAGVTVNDGAWHHVTATRQQATGVKRLYVDGREQGSAAAGTASLNALPGLDLGLKFDGRLDEVQISTVARDRPWVQLSYAAQKPGSSLVEIKAIRAPRVSVDRLLTSEISPRITGWVDDLSAEVEVKTGAGDFVRAEVGDDGSWFVPENTFSGLGYGVHDVQAGASNAAGLGTDTSADELWHELPLPTHAT